MGRVSSGRAYLDQRLAVENLVQALRCPWIKENGTETSLPQ